MKKTLAILIILLLAGTGLFADVDDTKTPSKINITSEVAQYSSFGVSLTTINNHDVSSIERFERAVSSSISVTVDMLYIYGDKVIGYLSGLNNTKSPVKLELSITDLVSGNNAVPMIIIDPEATIPAATNNAYGLLWSVPVKIKEKVGGSGRLAPAGNYQATITISAITS